MREQLPNVSDLTVEEKAALTNTITAESMARILQATVDGLQLQWLADPEIDMAALTGDLLTAFRAAGPDD